LQFSERPELLVFHRSWVHLGVAFGVQPPPKMNLILL